MGLVYLPLTLSLRIVGAGVVSVWLYQLYERTQFNFLTSKSWYSPAVQITFVASLAYFLTRELMFQLNISNPVIIRLLSLQKLPTTALVASALGLLLLPTQHYSHKINHVLNKLKPIYFVIILTLIGLGLRAHNLGLNDIRGDENQVVSAAAGYYHTGNYFQWDWIKDEPACTDKAQGCYYNRAWPHTWMIAQVYKIAGISEASSRIPSVIFGTLLILISYPIALFFTKSRLAALITTFLVTIAPSYISLSRYIRMYAILLPIFLLLVYSTYRAVSEFWIPKLLAKNKQLKQFFKTFLPFHWGFVVLGLVLLYFNYHIHINSLVIGPGMMLFVIFAFVLDTKRRKRWKIPAILALLGITAALLLIITGQFKYNAFISNFAKRNFIYNDYMFGYPFGRVITMSLFALGLGAAIFKKNLRIVALGIISLFSLYFFIYIADRYASFVYTSHLTILVLIVAVYGLVILFKKLKLIPLIISLLIFGGYFATLSTIEAGDRYHAQGGAVHSVAYQEIIDHYDPTEHTLFLQYGRMYYLRELDEINVVSMGRNGSYSFEDFISDLEKAKKGWIAWETGKSYHLQGKVKSYIEENFEKIHGTGVDDTGVEVYYFDLSK
jgi:hypothetical protein